MSVTVELEQLDDLLHEVEFHLPSIEQGESGFSIRGLVELPCVRVFDPGRFRCRYDVRLDLGEVAGVDVQSRDGQPGLPVAGVFVYGEAGAPCRILHIQSERDADLFVRVCSPRAALSVADEPRFVRRRGMFRRWSRHAQ
jgi:hypothetical protein